MICFTRNRCYISQFAISFVFYVSGVFLWQCEIGIWLVVAVVVRFLCRNFTKYPNDYSFEIYELKNWDNKILIYLLWIFLNTTRFVFFSNFVFSLQMFEMYSHPSDGNLNAHS